MVTCLRRGNGPFVAIVPNPVPLEVLVPVSRSLKVKIPKALIEDNGASITRSCTLRFSIPLLAIILVCFAAVAQGADSVCEPTRLGGYSMPQKCSIENMAATFATELSVSNFLIPSIDPGAAGVWPLPAPDDPIWQDNPPDLANGPLPGQARIRFSGLVGGGGGACVHHISAWNAETNLPSGKSDNPLDKLSSRLREKVEKKLKKRLGELQQSEDRTEGAQRAMEKIRDQLGDSRDPEDRGTSLRERKKEALEQRLDTLQKLKDPTKAQQKAMEQVRDRLRESQRSGDGEKRHVVFELFSTNLGFRQLALYNAIGPRPGAGWPSKSSGEITLELPEVAPADLAEGETYKAYFKGGNKLVYSDRRGRTRSFPYKNPPLKGCRANKGNAADYWANYPRVVAQVQQLDCSRKKYFIGKRRDVFAPELRGSVTIDRISSEEVVGSFEVGGTARLKTIRFELAENPDPEGRVLARKLGSRNLYYVRHESQRDGSLTVSGRFAAPNHSGGIPHVAYNVHETGHEGEVVTVEVPEQGNGSGDSKPSLAVKSHRPARGKRNVDWERPGIQVTFNRPVDGASVRSGAMTLSYRDAQWRMQEVPVDLQLADGRRVELTPRQPLKDGVRYRVTVEDGPDGVRSAQGGALGSEYIWAIYTTVDLGDDEDMPRLRAPLESEEGVEPHVFQTSRDASLVTSKPTLTRVYAKWKRRGDVARRWQVTKFPAKVRVKSMANAGDGLLYPEKDKVLIRRPDRYTEGEMRRAENSVNLYDWRPEVHETGALTVEIEPTGQCHAQRVFESDPLQLEYTGDSPTLDIDYYFVRTGEWAGDALESEKSWVKPVGHTVAQRGAVFATQNFPVRQTNARYRGTISAPAGTQQGGAPGQYVVSQVERKLADSQTGADVILLFMGRDISQKGGYAYRDVQGKRPGVVGVFLDPHKNQTFQKAVGDVVHEIGHTILDKGGRTEHYPRHTKFPNTELEGFRIALDGRDGVNKSFTEGNGSPFSRLGLVLPLMREGQDPFPAIFITNEHYSELVSDMQLAHTRAPLRGRTRLASAGDAAVPTGERPAWRISGFLAPEGNDANITGIERVEGVASEEGGGKWRAVLEGADGTDLASVHFRPRMAGRGHKSSCYPGAQPGAWHAFSVRLPRHPEAATLALFRDGERVTSLERSETAPDVAIQSVESGAEATVVDWQASDPDSESLVYDLGYSPDVDEPYRPISIGQTESEAEIPSGELEPGSNGRFRVTASDGFNSDRATAPLDRDPNLRAVSTLPRDGGYLAKTEPIQAVFNNELDPDSVKADWIRLRGEEGQGVPVTVRHDRGSRTIRIEPREPLVDGHSYTARISAAVSDPRGHTLGGPVTWAFTAGAADEQAEGPEQTPTEREPRQADDPGSEAGNGGREDVSDPFLESGDPDDVPVPRPETDPGEMPFNRAKVAHWIRTRIATNHLQNRMRANAERYDSVVQAFFRKREAMLEAAGWTVEGFEATEKRIMRAQGGIELAQQEDRDGYGQEQIEASREDWPAVRPLLDELEQLTDWVAGNVEEPPELGKDGVSR